MYNEIIDKECAFLFFATVCRYLCIHRFIYFLVKSLFCWPTCQYLLQTCILLYGSNIFIVQPYYTLVPTPVDFFILHYALLNFFNLHGAVVHRQWSINVKTWIENKRFIKGTCVTQRVNNNKNSANMHYNNLNLYTAHGRAVNVSHYRPRRFVPWS